jgi:hypothetical protein
MIDIRPYLEDLEQRIDPAGEQELQAAWDTFVRGECTDDLFIPRRSYAAPARIEWPRVSINQAQHDYDCMALSQLSACSWALAEGNGRVLCVRCNYGTPILPSLFGVELYYMEEELNTLPTCLPLAGVDQIRAQAAAGVPGIDQALWHEVRAMARHYQELFAPYPNISQWVHLYHPDVQGPMDCVELLWGSALFLALHDVPELAKQMLQLLTDTYVTVMNDWFELVPPDGDVSYHWSMCQPGRIMLRDDSAMNLSPEMFGEFIAPYDAQLLQRYGGGTIHFCGRGDHYIDQAAALPGLRAINMSQPELNDMEKIYRHTVDRGILMLDLRREAAEAALAANRDLHGRVHCW